MVELGWWWWFAGELVVVLVALLAVVWWRGARTIARLAQSGSRNRPGGSQVPAPPAPEPGPELPTLVDADVDAVDSGEAAELRAQLRRSVEEMTGVTEAGREVSTSVSADLMSLLEKQAEVQNLGTRASGVAGLPTEAKQALDALLEVLRNADPLLIRAQENLDQLDASLSGLSSELSRYGEANGFEWDRLRPTTEGLNRLLRLKVDPSSERLGTKPPSGDVELPPGLGDAIDQAII